MNTFRWLLVLSFMILSVGMSPVATAQTGEPTLSASYDGRLLSPGRASGVTLTFTNTTDTPIILYGVEMSSLQGSEACPAHWFGDAGYPDRPRGESETQPPVPPYPLPSVTLADPVQLAPGDAFTAPMLEIFMIEAAPNACQRARLFPSYSANWEFVNVQAYATVSGAISDSVSGAPIGEATVTITGTTDNGVERDIVTTAPDGTYASSLQFHAGTDVTAEVTAPGYEATSGTVTTVDGANTLNLTIAALPPAVVGVSGTVTDATSGEPIPGATVTLTGTDPNGAPLTLTLTADSQGAWTSDVVFAVGSDVTAVASASGYQPATITTTTGSDGVSGISLQLIADVVETPDPETPVPTENPGTETPVPTEAPGTETPVPTEAPGTETPVPTDVATETPGTETPVPTESPTETAVPAETVVPTSEANPVVDPGGNSGNDGGTEKTTSPVTSLPETGSGSQRSSIYVTFAVVTILATGALGVRIAKRG